MLAGVRGTPSTTNMPTKIFVDTSAFVSLHDGHDPNHKKALDLALRMDRENAELHTSSDVIGKTLTVISRKMGKIKAAEFFNNFKSSGVREIFIDEELHEQTRKFFMKVKSKNISFIDCSSVVAMKKRGLKTIFAFDQDFKKLGVSMLSL